MRISLDSAATWAAIWVVGSVAFLAALHLFFSGNIQY